MTEDELRTAPVMGSAQISPVAEAARRASLYRLWKAGKLPPKPEDRDGVFWYWTGRYWRAH